MNNFCSTISAKKTIIDNIELREKICCGDIFFTKKKLYIVILFLQMIMML